MADRVDLIISALREALAESNFQNAVLRADITILTQEKEQREQEATAYSAALTARLGEDQGQ